MKSQIYFKIKNEKSYDTIRFTGGSLSLKDLKIKIKEKLQDKNQGIGKEKDKEKAKDDILVYDELTKNLIPDDSTLIAADRKVVIERSSAIPTLGPAGYRSSYSTGIKADKSEFMCNLCKNQFVNPTLTRCCGGTACETCIDKNVKLKSECPFCHKKALGSIKAGPNVKLQEMMQKMPPSMPSSALPTAHAYGSQPVNPNVAMNLVPFKEIDKYLNGAKYFIIKSSNFENIQLSIKHSEWATTKANETKLNNAFQRSKNVILIFSVNKSSQFQGYARMESLSTNRAASWQVQDSIKLGGSFKILWLRVCNVNFSRVSQMKNKFNNGEPIKKSRDTQEIPEDIGFQICNMFELPDKDSTAMHYPTSSDRPKYMYQYGQAPTPMGYQNPVYTAASSPRDMRDFKVLSDSVSPSEAKSPMSKPGSDDFQSNIEKEEFYQSNQQEEEKKDEPEIDLLADLDFDEPTNFEPAPPVQEKPPAEVQNQQQQQIELEDDLPLEHAVANMEEILEMAEGEVSVLDEQELEIEPERNGTVEEKAGAGAQSETKESIPQEQDHDHDQDDFLHNFEPEEEEEAKEESRSRESEQKQRFIEEEDEERDYRGHQEEDRHQPPPPKVQYEEQRKASPSRSSSPAEEKKKPKPPAVDMNKFPPAPSMPYDAASMMRPDSYMPRPPPMVDHRPPPPNMMYPSAPQSMRYPYNNYPSAYPNTSYGSYPMAPYPGMDPRMQQMGMNPNYPYQYYNYPGMWGGPGGRPFPMDSRGKLDGNEGDGDNQSERSEESEGSRKREKKKHKKEKKKKRSKDRERERSRDKSREREKSNVREKGRSRDRSRNKSKSKSRRK